VTGDSAIGDQGCISREYPLRPQCLGTVSFHFSRVGR
jgi:hypothetical protein